MLIYWRAEITHFVYMQSLASLQIEFIFKHLDERYLKIILRQ